MTSLTIYIYIYIACTKKCYTVIKKKQTTRLGWDNDGANGESDPETSTRILIHWLTDHGNYTHYRGNKIGKKKTKIAVRIAAIMNAAGVKVQHDGKQVQNKIKHIVELYVKAEGNQNWRWPNCGWSFY